MVKQDIPGLQFVQKIEKLRLTADEKYAIETYIKDSDEINKFLRNIDNENVSAISIDYAQKLSNLIDEIITDVSRPLSGEITVWRGLRKGDVDILKPGDEWATSIGIVSTSFSRKVAERFARTPSGFLYCIVKLTIPPQFSALYLGNISEFDEKEVILPHRSIFVVTSKEKLASGTWLLSATCTKQKTAAGKVIHHE